MKQTSERQETQTRASARERRRGRQGRPSLRTSLGGRRPTQEEGAQGTKPAGRPATRAAGGGTPPPRPPLTSGRGSWRVRGAPRRRDACGIKAAGKGRAGRWQEPGGASELPRGCQERGSAECGRGAETRRDDERRQRHPATEMQAQRERPGVKTAETTRDPERRAQNVRRDLE